MAAETVAQYRAENAARMANPEVLEIAYHRNGISGDGFYVALVRAPEADQRVLTCIVPAWAVEGKKCPSGFVPCYVIDPGLAASKNVGAEPAWAHPGTVAFGENSWRGDRYYDLVVKAAKGIV